MRTCLFVCATGLLGLTFLTLQGVAAPNAEGKENPMDAYVLAERLQERVTFKDLENAALREVLEFLNDQYQLNILVESNFDNAGGAMARTEKDQDRRAVNLKVKLAEPTVLDSQITLKKVRNLRLTTVLNMICHQINATYLIYSDHISLVPISTATELIRGQDQDGNLPQKLMLPLVTMKIQGKALAQVLSDLSDRTDTSILLAPQAAEKAKATITAKLQNIPLDTAIEMLAEMGELKMVQKGNSYLVTTSEKAKLFAPPATVMNPQGGFGLGGNLGGNFEQPISMEAIRQLLDEKSNAKLKQKVEELGHQLEVIEKKMNEKK